MESKPKQVPVSLLPPSAYFATFMVNRFCLIKDKGFTIGYFGLMNESEVLLEKFGCIFTDSMLKDLRENLVTYSGQIGLAKNKPPAWNPTITDAKSKTGEQSLSAYGVVDFIHLTNWEDTHAEICFWSYSKAALADHLATKPNQPFQTWGLALLRCDIELQRAFLEALYPV